MNTLQQKQLAFLEDTVKFYNSNNRCVSMDFSCKYFLEGKAGCAIGRHISDKNLCKKLDKGIGESEQTSVFYNEVYELLPENLKELGQEFLSEIQGLHDSSFNWNNHGITTHGLRNVQEIKYKFNLHV